MNVFKSISDFIIALDISSISEDRKTALQPLIDFIQVKVDNKEDVNLNFICTHNSRRSHLAQIWAQTLACFYKIPSVFCYSAGTEETALFPCVLDIVGDLGFKINQLSHGKNPVYSIEYSEKNVPILGFSKRMDNPYNPKTSFAAVMTCGEAEENCPYIIGAERRISLTYEDPKLYDNTNLQIRKYEERNRQIATEISYVFTNIKIK